MQVISAYKAAEGTYRDALDAFVSVTTTVDCITKVLDYLAQGDIENLQAWASILDQKTGDLKNVAALLREYYTQAYALQYQVRAAAAPVTVVMSGTANMPMTPPNVMGESKKLRAAFK